MIACIEGNIASGKSTLLSTLLLDLDTIPEPVEQWGDLLRLFYEDPGTWALPFNLRVLCDFHEAKRPGVFERSPGACRYVFGQLSYNDGHMSPMAWDTFKEFHDLLGWEPDVYVYIDVPPEVCYERMRSRGRPEEAGVTLEYLQRIDFQYQNFLKFAKVPVVRVDGTRDDLVDVVSSILSNVT